MEFVELLTVLLFSFLSGLLVAWLLLRGLFKLIAKQQTGQSAGEQPSAE